MFRLLGFCLGSLLAVAALVALVGRPIVHTGEVVDDTARFSAAVEKLKAKQSTVPAPARASDDARPDKVDDVSTERVDAVLVEQTSEKKWHEFWTPFRSEIAAGGFMNRLEAVTGLDYRVVRRDKGDYQVMFAYAGEHELSLKLEQISAATGLDLSGRVR